MGRGKSKSLLHPEREATGGDAAGVDLFAQRFKRTTPGGRTRHGGGKGGASAGLAVHFATFAYHGLYISNPVVKNRKGCSIGVMVQFADKHGSHWNNNLPGNSAKK